METGNIINLFPITEVDWKAFEILRAQKQSGKEKDVDRMQREEKESRFESVLREINHNKEEARSKEKELAFKKLGEKIDAMEKKIEKIFEGKEGALKEKAEKIKEALDKIKKIMGEWKDSKEGWTITSGEITQDFLSFISGIIEELFSMIKPNLNEKEQQFLNLMNQKLDNLLNQIQKSEAKLSDNRNVLDNAYFFEEESKQNSEGKVLVIDKRDNIEEGMDKAIGKSLRNNSGKSKENEIKVSLPDILTKIEKRQETSLNIERMAKDLLNNIQKEASLRPLNKFENQPIFTKQYSNYSSIISKVHLEALMQNITGRALVTLKNGKSELRMNLIPPELGRMSLKFTLEDGTLAGKIVVSTQEAKMLFDQNLFDLQQSLQQAGISIGNLEVSFAGQQGSEEMEEKNFSKASKTEVNEIQTVEQEVNLYRSLYESSINYVV